MFVCQMAAVSTGQNFTFDGKTYVRLPEMNLQVGRHGFVVNCARVIDSGDDYTPATKVMEYICDRTIVRALETIIR